MRAGWTVQARQLPNNPTGSFSWLDLLPNKRTNPNPTPLQLQYRLSWLLSFAGLTFLQLANNEWRVLWC